MRSLGLLVSIPAMLSLACFHAESNETGDTGSSDGSASSSATGASATSATSATSADTTASTSGPSSTTGVDSTDTQDGSGSSDASVSGSDSSTGGTVCGEGEMACGAECVDPMTSGAHCGACDHDCLGGDCTAGVCEGVQLASGKGRLFMVQLDADHLYYGGDGVAVGRIDKDGANDIELVPQGDTLDTREWCYQSAITDTHVVWGNDWVQPGVRGCELPDCDGGVATLVPGSNMYTMVFNPANTTLYFDQGTNISSKIWPAGAQNNFAINQTSTRELAVDDGFVYWGHGNDMMGYTVRKQGLLAAASSNLVTGRVEPVSAIDVSATAIYWGEQDGGTGNVYMAPLPNGIGGNDPEVFGTVGGSIYDILVDDTHVYWIARAQAGDSIQRCPIAGCDPSPELLDTSDSNAWQMADDDVAIYWVGESGLIGKIAK